MAESNGVLTTLIAKVDVHENPCKPFPELIFCNKTTIFGKIRYINLSIEKELTPNSTSIWELVSQIVINISTNITRVNSLNV